MAITRRAFMQGAMLSACVLPGWTWPESEVKFGRRLQVDQVVFDARRSDALAFAQTARHLGAETRAFNGSVSPRECQDLLARLQIRKTAVAGLTDFRSLFLLQAMAAGAGLKPVLRIHHPTRGNADTHEAFGTQAYREICNSRLARYRDSWAHEAANLVLNLPMRTGDVVQATDNLDEADLRVLGSRAMVTWVIA
jgi:hypothetical protein